MVLRVFLIFLVKVKVKVRLRLKVRVKAKVGQNRPALLLRLDDPISPEKEQGGGIRLGLG